MNKKTKIIVATTTLLLAVTGVGGYVYYQHEVAKAEKECKVITSEVGKQVGELAKLQQGLDKLNQSQKDMGSKVKQPKLGGLKTISSCGYGTVQAAQGVKNSNAKTLKAAKSTLAGFSKTLTTTYQQTLTKTSQNELLSKEEQAAFGKEIKALDDPAKAKALLDKINGKIAENKKAKEEAEAKAAAAAAAQQANRGGTYAGRNTYRGGNHYRGGNTYRGGAAAPDIDGIIRSFRNSVGEEAIARGNADAEACLKAHNCPKPIL